MTQQLSFERSLDPGQVIAYAAILIESELNEARKNAGRQLIIAKPSVETYREFYLTVNL